MYVGHTTNFKNRKLNHKKNCLIPTSAKYNFPVYSFIRENGGWESWEMIFIEKLECKNELEALKRGRELIEQNQASLNRYKPYSNDEDWKKQRKRNEYDHDHPRGGLCNATPYIGRIYHRHSTEFAASPLQLQPSHAPCAWSRRWSDAATPPHRPNTSWALEAKAGTRVFTPANSKPIVTVYSINNQSILVVYSIHNSYDVFIR